MSVRSNAAGAVRNLCDTCVKVATNHQIGDNAFDGRSFNRFQSEEARYGLMTMSQTIGEGLVTVLPNIVTGAEWNFLEWVPQTVQSSANGGRARGECGFKPQAIERLRKKCKRISLELLHIDVEYCNTEVFKDTIFSDNGETSGLPRYINGGDTQEAARQRRDYAVEMLMRQFHSLALAIDGTNILGDWTGVQTGTLTKDVANNGSVVRKYNHYDGILKQTLLAGGHAQNAVTSVTLEALEADECYWFYDSSNVAHLAETPEELATKLNNIVHNSTSDSAYAVTLDGLELTIVAQETTQEAYGIGALTIAKGVELYECSDMFPGVVIQAAVDYDEEPLLFKHEELIDCENALDYFFMRVKDIQKKCAQLGFGQNFDPGYFAIDPLMQIDINFNEVIRMCKCDNALTQTTAINSFLPRFVPVEVLTGSGIWYWTTQSNVVFVTNTVKAANGQDLSNITIGYDEKCGTIFSKNEMLGNIIVVDFNKIATNACDSPFHKNLSDKIYAVDNLPEQCSTCVDDTLPTGGASPCITLVCSPDGVADASLELESKAPAGSTVVWEAGVGNETVALGTGIDLASAVAVDAVISYITLTIDGGERKFIPFSSFVQKCD